jgi:hypothetical protein
MVIKGTTEELLNNSRPVKRKCKNSPTTSKDQEEGEEVRAKGMRNIFNEIITENFPNLEKSMPIHVHKSSRTPNRPDQNRTTS